MTKTDILTEDVNRKGIVRILDKHLTGYTLVPTLGRWQGKNERSLDVQIFGGNKAEIFSAAEEIKRANHQQAVMINRDHVTSNLV